MNAFDILLSSLEDGKYTELLMGGLGHDPDELLKTGMVLYAALVGTRER